MNDGMTKPFLCTCEDENAYIVKGKPGLGKRELLAEYVSVFLAKHIGLPCPDFCIVDVSEQIIRYMPDLRSELSPGPAFATRFIESATTINIQQARSVVSERDQKKIYFFDRWICNSDRTLTDLGGNVNIIYDAVNGRYFLIDHNLAFSQDTTDGGYDVHVYSPAGRSWVYDMVDKLELRDLADDAISSLKNSFDQIPNEWFFSEDDFSQLIEEFFYLLYRPRYEDFWSNIT